MNEKNVGAWFDFHNHTRFSHDSQATPEDMWRAASARGLGGIAFTEHANVLPEGNFADSDSIDAAFPYIEPLRRQRAEGTEIFIGIEIAAMFRHPAFAREAMTAFDYDVILGSVHAVRTKNGLFHFYHDQAESKHHAVYCFEAYFEDLMWTVDFGGFDILPHLNYPLRYLNDRYGFGIDLQDFLPRYEALFKLMIAKDICLEVNTLNAQSTPPRLCPDGELLSLYRGLGGRLVSLGSDTHAPEHVGRGLAVGVAALKEAGFSEAYAYRRRKRFTYSL